MVYDKYRGVPTANSPLESLFILVYLQRQESELLATRALVEASLADEERKEAVEAFERYCTKMFPFWKRGADLEDDEERKALMELVKKPLKINLSEVYKTQAKALRRKAHKKSGAVPDKFRMKPR
jgi:hypothetical protein